MSSHSDKPAAAASAPEGHGAPAATGAANAKSSKAKSLLGTAKEQARGLGGITAEMGRGLRSSDRPTRRMSGVFFVCVVGLLTVFALAGERLMALRRSRLAADEIALRQQHDIEESTRKKTADPKLAERTVSLGVFTLELRAQNPRNQPTRGVYNMAEFEIILQCDSAETKAFVEEQIVQARNEVTNGLTPMDREELLSRDGKRALRKALIKRINLWLSGSKPDGKLEELFISNMVIT